MSDAPIMANLASSADPTTILVVDDEVLVRMMISEELRDQGHTVIEAANADEAAAVLRSPLRVDIVVTDLRMPGALDGAALVRLIRAEFPLVKVVMVAGQAPETAVHELLDGYLSKPITPSQVSSCVQTMMHSGAQ